MYSLWDKIRDSSCVEECKSISEQLKKSRSSISDSDQQEIADRVSENLNPPTPPSTTPTIDDIREFFRTLHKYSNFKYILRINDNFLLTLKSELGFSSTDPVLDFLLLNYVINIEIDNGIADEKFKLFGINANI